MKIRIYIITVFVVTLFMRCNSDKEEQNFKYKSDKILIETLVDKIIKPEILSFYNETINLQSLSKKFAKDITKENLQVLQTQWEVTAKKYATVYAFNIGDVKRQYFNLWINNWPINSEGLESKINVDREIDASYVKKMGSDVKGILALEYLLFSSSDKNKLIANFKTQKNRLKALVLIIDELVSDAENQKKAWDKYAPKLINNSVKKGNIENSFNIIFNGLNNVIHYAQETKIGKPSGFEKSGINKKKLEAPYSKKSLELIAENISITKKVFFDESIVSIADKIRFVTKNDKLNNAVKLQYEKIEKLINNMDNSIYDSLSLDKEKVEKLYKEIKRLEVLYNTDVKSTLSLIVTGTDGDGD